MVISHAKKFVVFAPWKSASSTTQSRLAEHNESPYHWFYDFNPFLQRVVHQHLTLADFTGLPESKLGYFLASFVRNPYDRVYSGFLQIQRDIQEQPTAFFPTPWVKTQVQRQLEANLAQLVKADFEFNNWVLSLQEHQIYEIGHNSSFPMHPAHYWTHLAGTQLVNFVGKVECFETDFAALCSTLGITEPEKVNHNLSETPTHRGPSQSGYRYLQLMNPASVDKINQLFKEDFELFGYEMARP